jgi:4-amino-4-deoxy-L-arabinose transferase-like glycosyltransferase
VHAYNADEIRRTGSFFSPNPILIATPRYPGLETATAALASVAGIGTFGAGLVVVGAARLIIVLALFLFLEGVSRSARIAGIGVVLYAATPNFLFFDAQFSYESLALPLALVAMLALLRWERADTVGESVAWLTVLFAAIIAVVVRLKPLAMAGCVVCSSGMCVLARPRGERDGRLSVAGLRARAEPDRKDAVR